MSGRAKSLKVKGQQPLDRAIIAATASAIPTTFHADFYKVIELLPAAIYITDAQGRLTYYNDAAADLWGHRPPLGSSYWCGSWRLYQLDGTPMPHDQCPMALAIKENRAIRGVEALAERPDGSRVRFRPFPTPLRDESGTLIGAVNMLVDVTDWRLTEQRLADSESRYHGIFEGARVALWEEDFSDVLALLDDLRGRGVTDLRGHFAADPDALMRAMELVRITDVNEYALELFGAAEKRDLLTSLNRVFLPATQAVFVEELAALWDGKRRFEGEGTMQTLHGRPLDVMLTIAFEGERCARTLVSILDISGLKAAQRDLREQQDRLRFLNRVAKTISSNLDLEHVVQTVTDIATEAVGARFGAFLYKLDNGNSDSYTLYAVSGAPREAFAKIELLRNSTLFDPGSLGLNPVRSDDIRKDARYRHDAPDFGAQVAQLRVASYLAVPVVSKTGQPQGGLFFGHDEAGIFTQEAEDIVAGIAAHAAIAIDNARLLRSAQIEILQRARTEQNARRLAAIIESSDEAIISKNLDGVITTWNRGAERLFGYTAQEAIGRPVTMLMPPERADEEPGILARIRRGEQIEHYDTVRRRKDGGLVDISLSVSPIKDADGKIIGASKIVRDITERKRGEQQQELLVGEVKHRIKNILATVQAIARQTLAGAPAAERDAFIARLMALANAQDLLTLERWNRAELHEVVRRALRPFEAQHSARFLTKGPEDIWVSARDASLLTMALHELATNAVKYGALSNAYGVVRLTWEVAGEEDAQVVRLTWRELGGPLVVPPERKGFGSFLIERALQGGGGNANLDYNPNGLICSLEVAI
ncbi:PAS domain-containing sensor histidine kinase [Dongia deserti]|uniref:PAS domain-containing sensor histidine kinase n=1 Tax=Dongia deserti TaxID=2268030 RepID=UPI000E64AFC5|nr:PAS domain S-box protein [Dongia deserti]